MKVTIALLAASLVSYVSADKYQMCCCTKTYEDSGGWGCDKDSTKAVVDASNGHFAFNNHFFWNINGAPIESSLYIYDTSPGYKGRIGAEEMAGWCKKHAAGQKCWNLGNQWAINYKGEKVA